MNIYIYIYIYIHTYKYMYINKHFYSDLSIDYDMAISMIKEAHSRGLVVHPWEIRVEPSQVNICICVHT
jgi:uncharacterized lipoprotein YddW (UPF0748 family)